MTHVTSLCGCACRTQGSKGQIGCHDNDVGLTKLYGKDAGTCLSAAASGVGCTMHGVANLCQCSCGHRHRRRAQAKNVDLYPKLPGTHLTSSQCPWDQFDDRLAEVSKACCSVAGDKCTNSVPEACSFECGRKFAAMMLSCGQLFQTLIVD
eukprot:COSAG01_NODE_9830_length_2329_cov_12.118834_3_plen_150_part_01